MWAHQINGYHRSGSRLRVPAACLGAVAVLYLGSFFTRDWRAPAPDQPGQPRAEQISVRPIRGAVRREAVEAVPADPVRVAIPVPRVDPEVTGAVPRNDEPAANSPLDATATVTNRGEDRSAAPNAQEASA